MADQSTHEGDLLAVSNSLSKWATARGVSRDAYVISLSEALQTNSNLAYWANYEHMTWLPRPRSSSARKMGNIGRVIAIIRNVLIFMPVALTWYAIGQATRAFEIYIETGGESTANFLEFWQNGGGGVLAEEWRIGNVATLDFQIIIVLILLSMAAGILQARAIARSAADNYFYDQERMELALQLDQILDQYKRSTPLTMSRDLARAFEKMVKSTKDLAVASSRIEKSTTAMSKVESSSKALLDSAQAVNAIIKGSLMPEVKKGATQSRDFAKQVDKSTQSLKKGTKDLEKQISGATKRVSKSSKKVQ
jgi:hypothetical protein